jgi:hypothetical protein
MYDLVGMAQWRGLGLLMPPQVPRSCWNEAAGVRFVTSRRQLRDRFDQPLHEDREGICTVLGCRDDENLMLWVFPGELAGICCCERGLADTSSITLRRGPCCRYDEMSYWTGVGAGRLRCFQMWKTKLRKSRKGCFLST